MRPDHSTNSLTKFLVCLHLIVVSKAFQVLSDTNLRAAYDANPHGDPTSRGGGGGGPSMSRGFGGGRHPGFATQGEVSPEELFRAFFGGGSFDQFGGGPGEQQLSQFLR